MKRQGFSHASSLVAAVFAVVVFGDATFAAAQTESTIHFRTSHNFEEAMNFARPFSAEAAITPPATVTTLVNFDGTNGSNPFMENLVQGKDGNLYGTTTYGGVSSDGVVFKVTPAGTLTVLHSFAGTDGQNPESGLVLGVDGKFYGTVYQGGTNGYGTIFKITSAGTLTTLYNFANTDGSFPADALVQGTDRNFYGTTSYGMPGKYGTVFKMTSGGTLTTLHSFDDTDGYDPLAGLVQGTDGKFYGTTATGGTGGGFGTVFKITSAGTLTSLHSFDDTDGWEPESQLIQASDGNFYGTTLRGGASADGEIFKITSAGTLTVLHSFDVTDGNEPVGGLVQATDGNFYGTTYSGGSGGAGTVFQMTSGGTLTTLYNFTGITDGSAPFGGLVQHTSGAFYGVTSSGGSGRLGTIFSLSTGLGPFVKPLPTSGKVGATITILGTNLTGVTSVTFNGTAASFTIGSSSFLTATVPSGATTGFVKVVTSGGTLKSNVKFRVP